MKMAESTQMVNRCVEDLAHAYHVTVECAMCIGQKERNVCRQKSVHTSMNAVRPKPHVQNVIQKNCSYVFLHDSKKTYSNCLYEGSSCCLKTLECY